MAKHGINIHIELHGAWEFLILRLASLKVL